MRVEVISREQLKNINNLVEHYPFNDYRYYRFPKDKLVEYLRQCIKHSIADDHNHLFVASDKGIVVGMAVLNFLPWDTEHFGFSMAQIRYLMADGDYARAHSIKVRLIAFISSYCKEEGTVHISGRVDAEDISSIHALESSGFKLVDTLVKYVFNCHKHRIYAVKDLCKVRMFKDQDLLILKEIARVAFTKDRFHSDPGFDRKKADELHVKWLEDLCRGEHERIFVAERNGRPIGFLAFRLKKELEKLMGCKIGGHGLNAVSFQAKGAYPSLVKALLQDSILHYDYLEFDTQVKNYEVLKVWQRFGFDFKRAQYTFHKWIL
jgi:RimJ/RimL family protein N-acetyltransferase